MEFPYWIARALCGRNKNIVSIELPKEYRDTYREILGADATVVDLHKLGPYFYAFGTLMLGFDHPDTADIAKTLLQVRNPSEAQMFFLQCYHSVLYNLV